nr:hypothetical protein Iba_chr03aCG14510 [Ipomoea batatas]
MMRFLSAIEGFPAPAPGEPLENSKWPELELLCLAVGQISSLGPGVSGVATNQSAINLKIEKSELCGQWALVVFDKLTWIFQQTFLVALACPWTNSQSPAPSFGISYPSSGMQYAPAPAFQ